MSEPVGGDQAEAQEGAAAEPGSRARASVSEPVGGDQAEAQEGAATGVVGQVRDAVAAELNRWFQLISELVAIDSGADHPDGISAVLEHVSARLADLGAALQWRSTGGFPHLRATIPGGESVAVLLGHADTVFERGTARARPCRRDGDRAYGPGVADMKGGLVTALAALEGLLATGQPRPTIEVVVVGDEETRTVPPPFLDELRGADACLVLECGRPGGGFVTRRKAGLWARVTADGHAAHSGTEPQRGANALQALCAEALRIAGLHGARPHLSVILGILHGGNAVNAIPYHATARFDIRSPAKEDLDWAAGELARFAEHAGVRLRADTEERWPPMRVSPRGKALARTYTDLAASHGIRAVAKATGGMSDGCWFSDAGVPTIDGLGPVGGDDHGPDEFMEVGSVPERAALLAGVLAALADAGAASAAEGEGQ